MKKAIAILLAVLMIAATAACGGEGSDSTSSPPATDSGSVPTPSVSAGQTVQEGFELPYVDFGYAPSGDPFARDKYQFAHIVMMHSPTTQIMVDMFNHIGTRLNFEVTSFDAYRDTDAFMNFIETNDAQGVDAMIIEGDFTTQDRIFEITNELGVIFMPGLSTFIDPSVNRYLRPSATLDSYSLGWGSMEYMLDNYEAHTGKPFDAEKTGFITIEFAIITEFNVRRDGAIDAYKARYGDYFSTNHFNLDTSPEPNPVAAECGYNYVATTIAAHPEFDNWIVFAVIEDFADGASRALEDMGYGDNSIVTSVHAAILMDRWDSGYNGCWVGAADTPNIHLAHAIISGLFLLLEGQDTPETLWQQYRAPGQDYTVILMPYTMVTKDNYKDYQAAIDRYINDIFK